MKRFFKKLVYGILYLILLSAIVFGFNKIFLKPPASCFDNIQNQGEEGVDCGGPCSNICLPPTIRPIYAEPQARVLPLTGGGGGILATIQNPNPDYALKDFVYNLNIRDASGAVLNTLTGHSFIYGGEIKYLAFPGLTFRNSASATADFAVTSTVWAKADSFHTPDLKIQSPSASLSDNNIQITGRLLNKDTVTFPTVTLIAVLGDNQGNLAGVSQTILDNVAPDETRNFTILHPSLPDVNLQATQVYVYALRPGF